MRILLKVTLILAALAPALVLATSESVGRSARVSLSREVARADIGEQSQVSLADLARQAVTRRSQRAASLGISAQAVSLEVLAASTEPARSIRIRVKKSWAEFRDDLSLPRAFDMTGSTAVEDLAAALDQRYSKEDAAPPVIALAAANAALASCKADLKVELRGLQPPYFNNDTGVRWFPDQGVLAYNARAVINLDRNECLKAVVDLRSAEVSCVPIACWIR